MQYDKRPFKGELIAMVDGGTQEEKLEDFPQAAERGDKPGTIHN